MSAWLREKWLRRGAEYLYLSQTEGMTIAERYRLSFKRTNKINEAIKKLKELHAAANRPVARPRQYDCGKILSDAACASVENAKSNLEHKTGSNSPV